MGRHGCDDFLSHLIITPVEGTIFETKNRAIFSGELFSGEEFREKQGSALDPFYEITG